MPFFFFWLNPRHSKRPIYPTEHGSLLKTVLLAMSRRVMVNHTHNLHAYTQTANEASFPFSLAVEPVFLCHFEKGMKRGGYLDNIYRAT